VEFAAVQRHDQGAADAVVGEAANGLEVGRHVAVGVAENQLDALVVGDFLRGARHVDGGGPAEVAGEDLDGARLVFGIPDEDAAAGQPLENALVDERLHRATHGHARETVVLRQLDLRPHERPWGDVPSGDGLAELVGQRQVGRFRVSGVLFLCHADKLAQGGRCRQQKNRHV